MDNSDEHRNIVLEKVVLRKFIHTIRGEKESSSVPNIKFASISASKPQTVG